MFAPIGDEEAVSLELKAVFGLGGGQRRLDDGLGRNWG